MKSPIKEPPLRNPGESLDKQIDELVNDKALSYFIYIFISLLFTLMEWWRWYFERPPEPILYSIIFVIIAIYSVPKLFKIVKRVRLLRQGRDGEKVVGQFLETLRELGAKVFHDIPAESFNVDHVVIAPGGIYVIETKTYSKPDSGQPLIRFDGKSIRLNNGRAFDEPVIQTIAASNWIKTLLKESTGRDFNTKPVLVFPGWYIETDNKGKNSPIWVLNPKALPDFISNSKISLSNDEVNMAAFHLSRYVRTFNKNGKKK